MIEQRFRSGVRYLWNKPNDTFGPLNGAIVPNVGVATNLSYDGLDGHPAVIDPLLLLGNPANVLGFAVGMVNVPYTWLDYAPRRTARVAIGVNDILSGYMSGCLIIRGTYGGAMSAFHVGTIDGDDAASRESNRTVKQQFAQNLPADATGFNPLAAWPAPDITAVQTNLGGPANSVSRIFALMTTVGTFYSILMLNVKDNTQQWQNPAGRRYWCVGGIRQMAPMNRIMLMARLVG
ncbi:hypothetical protein OKW21_001354 [Catalinimonas alkaloidigena]|uniref:hypothetical protein n=1 Tax=Catalinimonas alkaloidigena TaxID=1075417 RepID=UPI00240726F4|nr:hypothetical protein [Catalinimonas alkaloidigena]MDF9796091.1 hypothetical protein [Catalinimonas alkaloidigena]